MTGGNEKQWLLRCVSDRVNLFTLGPNPKFTAINTSVLWITFGQRLSKTY